MQPNTKALLLESPANPLLEIIDVQGVGYEVFAPSTVLDDWTTQDFLTGMHLLGASGDPATKCGLAIYKFV